MNSNSWIVNCRGLENDRKLRVVTVFPSNRNFVPKFSLCWSLERYWWEDDDMYRVSYWALMGVQVCRPLGPYCLKYWMVQRISGLSSQIFLNGIIPFLGKTFNNILPLTWNSKGLQLIELVTDFWLVINFLVISWMPTRLVSWNFLISIRQWMLALRP